MPIGTLIDSNADHNCNIVTKLLNTTVVRLLTRIA